jgi:hypothetical protein
LGTPNRRQGDAIALFGKPGRDLVAGYVFQRARGGQRGCCSCMHACGHPALSSTSCTARIGPLLHLVLHSPRTGARVLNTLTTQRQANGLQPLLALPIGLQPRGQMSVSSDTQVLSQQRSPITSISGPNIRSNCWMRFGAILWPQRADDAVPRITAYPLPSLGSALQL